MPLQCNLHFKRYDLAPEIYVEITGSGRFALMLSLVIFSMKIGSQNVYGVRTIFVFECGKCGKAISAMCFHSVVKGFHGLKLEYVT